MNILVLGTGGREHALAWACAKDTKVDTVYVATGNAGTAIEPKLQNIDLDVANHDAVIKFCQDNNVEFVLVGPEAPLVAGVVDDRGDDIAGADILASDHHVAQSLGPG